MTYVLRRQPTRTRVELRGVAHQITVWGDPDAEPVFMLHGWGDSGETFQFLVDAFSTERRWIALDWRGFGASQWTGPSYWFPDYLADLEALLNLYAPSGTVELVGHSMGGNIVSLYAGVRPERVSRVINLEGIGMPHIEATEAPLRYARWLDQVRSPPAFSVYPSVQAFAAVLSRRNPRLPADRATFVAERWLMPCEGGYTLAWDPAHKSVNPVLYSRPAAQACWGSSSAPTLLVLGGVSDIRRALGAEGEPSAYEGRYPGWSVQTMPEAGHMMHHEQPEELARIIESFSPATVG
jgi:pimeloyl-ACP methyl ester carboxylesterase